MRLDISKNSLPVYKALDSPVRLSIIKILADSKTSVRQLSAMLHLSSAVLLMHLNKLADAKIISFERAGHNKVAKLNIDRIDILFPNSENAELSLKTVQMPVGQFTNFRVKPSCGLAGPTGYIGQVDNPASFSDPQRAQAGMVWLADGFVEYKFPNYLTKADHLESIELSMELGSEFPFSKKNWPSDITFTINGDDIGMWTSPGDFADHRGKYTPSWIPDKINQYGFLKTIRITDHATFLDNEPLSPVSLNDLNLDGPIITVRSGIKENATHKGGCTLFGKGFGNHDQDIEMKLFHS